MTDRELFEDMLELLVMELPAGSYPELKAALRERLARQEDEDLASLAYDMIDHFLRNNLDDGDYAGYSAALDRIYERPQPAREWVGLTKEEYQQIEKETTVGGYHGDYNPAGDVIEVTEAKLKEKNT